MKAIREESPTFRALLATRDLTVQGFFDELTTRDVRVPEIVYAELPKLLREIADAIEDAKVIGSEEG